MNDEKKNRKNYSVITDIPDLIITEYMFPLKGE
ncbi:hypothetical protein BvCmsC51A_03080 [Escherichia coli]|nr:hypothetical protein BvCmsC51A_03080 [Escherichia coli]GDF11956.1 hypothetical protein BvCmsKKNP009_04608 [Escherichia coli]